MPASAFALGVLGVRRRVPALASTTTGGLARTIAAGAGGAGTPQAPVAPPPTRTAPADAPTFDPVAYTRDVITRKKPAGTWQAHLDAVDPELSQVGITRAGTSTYRHDGTTFDVRSADGHAWAWDAAPTVAGTPSGDVAVPRPGTPAPPVNTSPGAKTPNPATTVGTAVPRGTPLYQDPIDPLAKYRGAIDAALRQRRRSASGGRASTIAGGFSGGTPVTRQASLGGGGY